MSEARNVYPRLCWGCLGIIEDFQHDHALLDYGGYCTDCREQQRDEMAGLRQALQGYTELMNEVSARDDIMVRVSIQVATICQVVVNSKACGKPAQFRAGVPTTNGPVTIPVCEEHCPGIYLSQLYEASERRSE